MTTEPSGSQPSGTGDPPARHLAPTDDLTIFEAGEFKESLVKLFSNEGLVSLDLGGVDRVDTSAIQLLLSARKQGRMFVTGITEELQRKLTQLGFHDQLSE